MHRRPRKSPSPREMRGNSTCGRAYSFHALPSLSPYRFPGLLKLGGGQSASIAAGAARRRASPLVGLTRSYTVSRQTLCGHSPDVRRSARYRCRTSTDRTAVFFSGAKSRRRSRHRLRRLPQDCCRQLNTHVASRSGHSPSFDADYQYSRRFITPQDRCPHFLGRRRSLTLARRNVQ
jgi:hypothetical protein